MKHTQEQIDLLADVYYDGMASVMDRIEEISRVEETNAYIKKRFGAEPSDSELIIEGTVEEIKDFPVEVYLIKYVALFFALVFVAIQFLMIDNVVLSVGAVCVSTVFTCTFFIMSHIEKFSGR